MKNIVMMIVSAMICVITMIIIIAMSGRMNRSVELQENLSTAVEVTLAGMAMPDNHQWSHTNEFIADFIENLVMVLETDSDITVDIMKADEEKGILAVRVVESFIHPNGRKGTVACEKTVIFNRFGEEEQQQYTVSFYLNKEDMVSGQNCYKKYTVKRGDGILEPAAPQNKESIFTVWKDLNDYIADFSQPAEQNLSYYAEWNERGWTY